MVLLQICALLGFFLAGALCLSAGHHFETYSSTTSRSRLAVYARSSDGHYTTTRRDRLICALLGSFSCFVRRSFSGSTGPPISDSSFCTGSENIFFSTKKLNESSQNKSVMHDLNFFFVSGVARFLCRKIVEIKKNHDTLLFFCLDPVGARTSSSLC